MCIYKGTIMEEKVSESVLRILARSGENIEGMEFPDTLDLLRHSLVLNAQSTLSDLEKKTRYYRSAWYNPFN